jgi:transcriptional regulator with XRE-family HTH domain
MITPGQCLEARELLGWSRTRLGVRCGLSHTDLLRFEMGRQFPKSESLAAIQQALEEAGVEFIPDKGGGPGMRLSKGAPK